MEAQEGKWRFREADRLFLAEQYRDALRELAALDRAYPNTKNILYPMALCLERLGRGAEAVPLCRQLIADFRDHRAEDLLARLSEGEAAPPDAIGALLTDDFSGAYELPDLGETPFGASPVHAEENESRWPNFVLGGAAVLILTGLMTARAIYGDGSEDVVGPTVTPQELGAFVGLLLTYFALSQVVGTIAAIFALGTLSKLPENTISGNVYNVGGAILIVNLASMIIGLILGVVQSLSLYLTACLVQHVIMVLIINHYYRLGCGGMFVFGFMYFIFSLVGVALPYLILLSALGVFTFIMW